MRREKDKNPDGSAEAEAEGPAQTHFFVLRSSFRIREMELLIDLPKMEYGRRGDNTRRGLANANE